MNRTNRVRLSLVAITALLTSLLAIQPGHSQISGNPSGIRGGISGNPTGISGISGRPGISGISGNPTGITGISGRTGISGIGGIPTPPPFTPPTMPAPPPGFGRIPGAGNLGPNIYEWSCSRCRRVLGTGANPPSISKCPGCGALLVGTDYGPGGNPGVPGGNPAMPGGMGGGNPNNPGIPPNNNPQPFTPPANPAEPPPNFDGAHVSVPPSSAAETPAPVGGKKWLILSITIGVLVLIAAAILIIYAALPKESASPRPKKKGPKSKPSWRDEDDDEDDDRPRRRRRYRDDDDD